MTIAAINPMAAEITDLTGIAVIQAAGTETKGVNVAVDDAVGTGIGVAETVMPSP